MQQSNAIAGAIIIAFLVFITMRGKLPAYLGLLLGEAGGSSTAPTTGTIASSTPTQIRIQTSGADPSGGSSSNPLPGLTAADYGAGY